MTNDDTTEKDRAEVANEQGFTGTFQAFIAWLEASLIYGGVRALEKAPNDLGHPVTTVETFTGGYSSDEALLGRLRFALWPNASWVRSERGGLTVYEFGDTPGQPLAAPSRQGAYTPAKITPDSTIIRATR